MTHAPSRHASLRAALIAVVLSVHGILAVPLGEAVTTASLARADVGKEVDRWMGLAGAMGFSRPQFEALLIDASAVLQGIDKAVSRPLKRLVRPTGTGQGWALFAVPEERPRQLVVTASTPSQNRVLFRMRDPAHRWLDGPLRYRRLRGIHDRGRRTGSYKDLAAWIAVQAMREDPTVTRVEVVQRKGHVGTPDAPRSPTTEPTLRVTLTRDDLVRRGLLP